MEPIESTTNSSATSPNNAAALESVHNELMKIPVTALRPINLDIPTIILVVMGALTALRALRATIAAVLGEAQAAFIDKLLTYTQAMSQAHAEYLIALLPINVQTVSDELVGKRDVLASDANVLVKRKLIQAGELGELRGSVGFTNQIYDVFQLVALYRKHWSDIEAHTGVTPAELDSAERLAQRFTQVLADRERAVSEAGVFAEMRQRAYTGLLNTWDQVRRAVIYVRWTEGDADLIAPSLWAGRSRRVNQDPTQADAPTPVLEVPVASTSTTPVAATPATPVVGEPVAPIAPGLPGASPFLQAVS